LSELCSEQARRGSGHLAHSASCRIRNLPAIGKESNPCQTAVLTGSKNLHTTGMLESHYNRLLQFVGASASAGPHQVATQVRYLLLGTTKLALLVTLAFPSLFPATFPLCDVALSALALAWSPLRRLVETEGAGDRRVASDRQLPNSSPPGRSGKIRRISRRRSRRRPRAKNARRSWRGC
jgi:hypothetical protein